MGKDLAGAVERMQAPPVLCLSSGSKQEGSTSVCQPSLRSLCLVCGSSARGTECSVMHRAWAGRAMILPKAVSREDGLMISNTPGLVVLRGRTCFFWAEGPGLGSTPWNRKTCRGGRARTQKNLHHKIQSWAWWKYAGRGYRHQILGDWVWWRCALRGDRHHKFRGWVWWCGA